MKSPEWFDVRIAAFFGAMALAACDMGPTGYSAPYKAMNSNPVKIRFADDAPSISQQFRPPKHYGIDIYHPIGSAVLAAASGVVTRSWTDAAYGRQLILTHGPDVEGRVYQTIYRHLSAVSAEEGERVARGQPIGLLGNSGALSAGLPHLHFEVWMGGGEGAVDPNLMWEAGPGLVRCYSKKTDSGLGVVYPVGCGRAAP
jgi:murein DD-endopeptidase MepM/ murein hydrolase activator NlpD